MNTARARIVCAEEARKTDIARPNKEWAVRSARGSERGADAKGNCCFRCGCRAGDGRNAMIGHDQGERKEADRREQNAMAQAVSQGLVKL